MFMLFMNDEPIMNIRQTFEQGDCVHRNEAINHLHGVVIMSFVTEIKWEFVFSPLSRVFLCQCFKMLSFDLIQYI